MRRYVFRLAILTLAVLGPTVARADDQAVAEQIVQQLQAEKKAGSLKGFSIDLSVEDGVVWLSGRVANETQQAKALDIARRVPGVKQVVNDLECVDGAKTNTADLEKKGLLSNVQSAIKNAVRLPLPVKATPIHTAAATLESKPAAPRSTTIVAAQPTAIGTGVQAAPAVATTAAPATLPTQPGVQPQIAARPITQLPPGYGPVPAYYGYAPQPVPVYRGSQNQVPLAFAPASPAHYTAAAATGPFHHHHHGGVVEQPMESYEGVPAEPTGPVPMSGVAYGAARYDHPQMPCYAWPSYAAYPNYAAVTYPKQYSPTAWPYIGPFYPYPQVPLGWRKVTLEWDDGWWFLDFKDRRTMYNH